MRIIRLEEPLIPDTRYVIYLRDVRSLSGNVNSPRGQVRAPRPVAPASRPAGTGAPRFDGPRLVGDNRAIRP